jgi:hypothetical protein
MTHEQALQIILRGPLDERGAINVEHLSRGAGVPRGTILHFLSWREGSRPQQVQQDGIDRLGWYVWRTMNKHVLISDEDRQRDLPVAVPLG